jgi:bifunctional NMN adenylyltransferase/nudix hydrolase
MTRKYDIAVVIGRFEPFHNVHKQLVDKALELGDKVVILLGTYKSAPDPKNPFTVDFRTAMIQTCYHGEDRKRLNFVGLRDKVYNNPLWLAEAQNIVREFQDDVIIEKNIEFTDVTYHAALNKVKVALVGYEKDETSSYIHEFPQWTLEHFNGNTPEGEVLNATDIRKMLFEGDRFEHLVPPEVATLLNSFKKTEPYFILKGEYDYNKKYKADSRFVGMPFDPTFNTTDAVVICNGHVLLVKRGHNPGKGLMALPGGFLQPDLWILDNTIKELREETKIKVSSDKLRKSLKSMHVFEYPYRSLRGRTVTFGHYFELDSNGELPTISRQGGDDAAGARWVPISSLADYEDKFFEDHYEIINHFIRRG